MIEARKLFATNLAALAAERVQKEHLMVIAEELAEMYATIDDPRQYLLHDVCFHRAIAHAAGNPILAALMATISTTFYEARLKTAEYAMDRKNPWMSIARSIAPFAPKSLPKPGPPWSAL